jgi:hypothetical protein
MISVMAQVYFFSPFTRRFKKRNWETSAMIAAVEDEREKKMGFLKASKLFTKYASIILKSCVKRKTKLRRKNCSLRT